jgi:hypothetical protein
MNCTICKQLIVLVPSAAERARKFGETAAYYTSLLTAHSHCTVAKRNQDVIDLMRRTRSTK